MFARCQSSGAASTHRWLLPQEAEAILASIAGMLGTQIDSEHPIIEAELPLDGSRIEGMVPPLVASPCFAIRKPAAKIHRLELAA